LLETHSRVEYIAACMSFMMLSDDNLLPEANLEEMRLRSGEEALLDSLTELEFRVSHIFNTNLPQLIPQAQPPPTQRCLKRPKYVKQKLKRAASPPPLDRSPTPHLQSSCAFRIAVTILTSGRQRFHLRPARPGRRVVSSTTRQAPCNLVLARRIRSRRFQINYYNRY